MPTKKAEAFSPRMSDEAVQAKTGKIWKEWFSILDRAGGRKMTHQEIVKYLHDEEAVGPWWTQMVTVTYEQARGLRDKHQKADGYQISASRTLNVPIGMAFDSFANARIRKTWLGEDGLVIRTQSANKSIRITWPDKKTSVEVGFYPKTDVKSLVSVQHSKLPTDKAAAKMKVFWKSALDRLQALLES